MRRIAFALALSLATAPALAAEGIVGCQDFKKNWTGALARLDVSKTAPTYGNPAASNKAEQIAGLAGLDGLVICREDSLGRLELRGAGDPARFEKALTAVLMGLDREFTPASAGTMMGALKAEMRAGKTETTSSWGPYEITWSRKAETKSDELVVDMAEN